MELFLHLKYDIVNRNACNMTTWRRTGQCLLQVYIDGRERAVLDATQQTPMINLGPLADARLDVIVENMGRVNYAEFRTPVLNSQRKGDIMDHSSQMLVIQRVCLTVVDT